MPPANTHAFIGLPLHVSALRPLLTGRHKTTPANGSRPPRLARQRPLLWRRSTKRVPFDLRGPKGSRNQEVIGRQRLTPREKESIVTKRVPFGEPFSVANFSATHGFTEDAESESSRRLAFYALSGNDTYDVNIRRTRELER